MDIEDEMFEEHLDEEYQNSEIEEQFTALETQIVELEKKQSTAHNDHELQDKLEKAIALLRLHVQSYQRIIIFNRRRAKQRLRRRQCTLRNFFLQSLMETQIRFVEMLPLALEPQLFLENNTSEDVEMDKTSHASNPGEESDNEDVAEPLCFYKDAVTKFTEYQWLDTFHIPKHIFELICSRLRTSLETAEMHFETWIAMCIYMMATGSKFSYVAMLFNVEKRFARRSLFKFIVALLKEFSEKHLSMPKSKSEFEKISNGFQKASNMTPCVAGVLCLFELPSNCDCGRNKACRGKNVKVQVCIDNQLLFRKVEITTQKPTMFLKSPNEVSLNWKKFSESCVVPYFIVAPPGYPLRTWLMQKYDKPSETWEYDFNKCFGSLNIFREVSLKRLFGRWHILNSSECILPESKSFIIKACCLLHNILEERREYFSVEWCKNFNPCKYEYKLSAAVTQFYNDSKPAMENRNSIAKLIRLTKIHNIEDEFETN